ncbi:MAG: carboxylesterase family protein, partial [Persicimonas sp.]
TLFASPFEDISSEEYEQMVHDSFPNQYEDVLDQYPVDDFDEPWKALAAIIGDVGFVCPTRAAARAHTRAGQPVYTYYYTHETAVGEWFNWGAFHGSDLSFVFGNFGSLQTTAAEERLSAAMQTYWTQFAATGEPGEFDGVDWPVYDTSEDEGLEFVADELGTIADFRSEYCDFWRR